MRWMSIAVIAMLAPAIVSLSQAQSVHSRELATGKLLVASKDLPDPNFAKTVVLLVQYDDDGVVGLILNRRSTVPVSRLLDDMAVAKGRPDPVYAGGPVGRTEVLALVRASHPPADARRVLGDLFLAASKDAMEKTLSSAAGADAVHVYLGYSGWTAAQLQHELDLGAWFVFPGSAKAVFDSDPESLWPRLIRETELRMASRDASELTLRAAVAGPLPRD